MPKEAGEKLIVQNKKARHDYAIEDKYEAGLALTGTEVKSLREGRASLSEAFVSIDRRGEMWLEGANIPEYLNGTWNNHAPKRKRKLLLHRVQIAKLARGIEAKGYTIVPLSLISRTVASKRKSPLPEARGNSTSVRLYVRSRTSARPCAPCAMPTCVTDLSTLRTFSSMINALVA